MSFLEGSKPVITPELDASNNHVNEADYANPGQEHHSDCEKENYAYADHEQEQRDVGDLFELDHQKRMLERSS